MVSTLKMVKRQISDEELVTEINEAMNDPAFRQAVKDFVKRTTS